MGKWDAIVAKLPRALGTEPVYQEKVDALKRELLANMPGWKASELAYAYREARQEKEDIEVLLADAELELEAISQLMVNQYEAEKIKSVGSLDGSSVAIQYEPQAQVTDKEALRLWCVKAGLERSLSLPWMTLNSMLKELLQQGEPEPPGVTAACRTKIVLRKG